MHWRVYNSIIVLSERSMFYIFTMFSNSSQVSITVDSPT